MKRVSIFQHIGLLLPVLLFVLSGCSKSQTDDDKTTGAKMTLTTDKQTVGSQGGPFTIEVQCNVDYTVELPDAPEWLREVTSGTPETGLHRFEADPNEDYDNRTARIVFTNRTFGLSRTFTLTQMQKNAILIAQRERRFPDRALRDMDPPDDVGVRPGSCREDAVLHHRPEPEAGVPGSDDPPHVRRCGTDHHDPPGGA